MRIESEKWIADEFIFHYNNNDFYPMYQLLSHDAVMQIDGRTVVGRNNIVKYFKQLKFQNQQEVWLNVGYAENTLFQTNIFDDSYEIEFNLKSIENNYQIVSIHFRFSNK